MAVSKRLQKVNKLIRAEVAEIVLKHVQDPRVQTVTITEVRVSPDLSQAKVFFVPVDDSIDNSEVTKGLSASAGFIRKLLSDRVNMKRVPNLRFILDSVAKSSRKMEEVLMGVRGEITSVNSREQALEENEAEKSEQSIDAESDSQTKTVS